MSVSTSPEDIVIVGGSIAAVTAAQALRAEGFAYKITMVSAETRLPYSRVPLSKSILSGSADLSTCALQFATDDIEIRLSQRATALDDRSRTIILDSGEVMSFDGLIIACGARARRLAGDGQIGEYVVRDADDIPLLAERLSSADTVVVVGAGFLGMEIASTCVQLGLDVTVIDRDPPLQRLLGPWLAKVVVRRAEAAGVRFVLASQGVQLLGEDRVSGVRYGETELRADVVVSAVGDIPNVEWLHGSRLDVRGGVVVDERCVAAPGIVAAGDVATVRQPSGEVARLPHWNNAIRQARSAALSLLHGRDAPVALPDHYFWTDAFGLQIKVSGIIPAAGSPTILEQDDTKGAMLLQWKSADGVPIAAAAINRRLSVRKLHSLANDELLNSH